MIERESITSDEVLKIIYDLHDDMGFMDRLAYWTHEFWDGTPEGLLQQVNAAISEGSEDRAADFF